MKENPRNSRQTVEGDCRMHQRIIPFRWQFLLGDLDDGNGRLMFPTIPWCFSHGCHLIRGYVAVITASDRFSLPRIGDHLSEQIGL